jgi:glycogen debranching enzyme
MLNLDLILKNNELCLVGQPRGRVSRKEAGLFVRDTRFLNQLDITFAGESLLILDVHTLSPDNVVITATNPALHHKGTDVDADTILVRINIRLTTTVTCTVTVENFGRSPLTGDVQIAVAADFRDMFEVRGQTAKHPVEPLPPRIAGTTALLSARCGDGAIASSLITGPSTSQIHEREWMGTPGVLIRTPVTLGLGESAGITVEIKPEPVGAPLKSAESFTANQGFAPTHSFISPSSGFNAFVSQCDADLALLQTTFPAGNIPAAGIPWYIAPFGRDSLIVALQTMHLYPVRSAHTLQVLAALQGTKRDAFTEEAPGKILHEMRYGTMARTREIPHTPYYGSVDSTPLFVMAFARHYLWHRDGALYDHLIDNVRRGLDWIETDGDLDGDGFLEFSGEQLEATHISQQGWKDSFDSLNFADGSPVSGPIALVEVQGYVYAAYAWLANAARLRGDSAWANELSQKASTLREKVESSFWMEDQQFYAQALDGNKTPVDAISSNPGHLLYCGLPSQEHADAVARRFAAPDMNSGWGLRTLSSDMTTYNPMSYHNGSIWPHDNSLAMAGLRNYGHAGLARELALVIADLASNDPELRIAELYCGFGRDVSPTGPVNYPRTCLPQAWAAGAGILAATTLLGIDLDDSGAITATPHLPDAWDHIEASGFRAGGRTYTVRAHKANGAWESHVTET